MKDYGKKNLEECQLLISKRADAEARGYLPRAQVVLTSSCRRR